MTRIVAVAFLIATVAATPNSSKGCGVVAPKSGKQTFTNQGHTREFWMHVPNSYDKNTATPLVILFHGWGYSGKEWYSGSGPGAVSAVPAAEEHGFILVAPTGLTDSRFPGNCDNGAGNCGWNGAGTSGSPGPLGPTCNKKIQKEDDCYYDTCADGCKDICSWSTCNDDTTMVHALLDKLEGELCVDQTRIYAGGESNGGMMTWQMGTDSRAARFAAFVATIGLPHHGFNFLPAALPMPIMGIWGKRDSTIPPGDLTSEYTQAKSGWYYTTARSITKDWAHAHGCNVTAAPTKYSTSIDGTNGLACTAFASSCGDDHGIGAPVVDCRFGGYFFGGGHEVKAFVPNLMWEFFSKHTRILAEATIV